MNTTSACKISPRENDWNGWIAFFLQAITTQAKNNNAKVAAIMGFIRGDEKNISMKSPIPNTPFTCSMPFSTARSLKPPISSGARASKNPPPCTCSGSLKPPISSKSYAVGAGAAPPSSASLNS